MSDYTKKNISKKHQNKLGYIDPTVAGIDIGDKLIHVAIPNNKGGADVQEFGTTTPELRKIVDILKKSNVTIGVMEATGVYWIPLYEIMEESNLTPILVDAKNVKNPPGRKTDVEDAQWIPNIILIWSCKSCLSPPTRSFKIKGVCKTANEYYQNKAVRTSAHGKSFTINEC